eukprot:TRINITY_DN8908_c1_g1_i16.p1 TRINITY_DN8908_c1_g1~~TRINITY_DN8908_c1_g1_i16.p1  ORF type:complete len:401 (+),score=100.47 TRINITY_DN8908_c1_g1_i16:522-1724(+)
MSRLKNAHLTPTFRRSPSNPVLNFDRQDTHFRTRVDNYALLCLDIMWTYLQLGDVVMLGENEWRLSHAENILLQTYGENNQRLKVLKDGSCAELVVFIRLYLLMGFCAYNHQLTILSTNLFKKAQQYLQQMTLTEEELLPLLVLGTFSEAECRVGLRAMNKNPELAEAWLYQRRERIETMKLREKEEEKKKQRCKSLGKTKNGNWVNLNLLDALVVKFKELQIPEKLIAEALKQTDNDQEATEDLLCNPNLLETLQMGLQKSAPQFKPPKEAVENLMTLGDFSSDLAYGTLQRTEGNLAVAADLLLSGKGIAVKCPYGTLLAGQGSTLTETEQARSREEQVRLAAEAKAQELQKTKELKNSTLDSLRSDGIGSRNDIEELDVDLTEETEFFMKYKSLLNF